MAAPRRVDPAAPYGAEAPPPFNSGELVPKSDQRRLPLSWIQPTVKFSVIHVLVLTSLWSVKGLLESFGIYMIKDKDNMTLEDVLQPGTNMIAEGYCMYGSFCMLVLSTGNGRFVEKCKYPKDGSPPKSLRYIGRWEVMARGPDAC